MFFQQLIKKFDFKTTMSLYFIKFLPVPVPADDNKNSDTELSTSKANNSSMHDTFFIKKHPNG